MKKIAVIGSINIDLVFNIKHFPMPGETINCENFSLFPGGKGANQAVAAGKLGADVTFLGKVGRDSYGEIALSALKEAGVKTDHIETVDKADTGIALISVAENGENTIVLSKGTNALVDTDYLLRHIEVIEDCDIVLLQLEIPMATVEKAAEIAASRQKIVILDPAPARPLSDTLLTNIVYITPNETEIKLLSGIIQGSEQDIFTACKGFAEKGVKRVINKAGEKGAYIFNGCELKLIKGYPVKAIDTTAAGDTFNAAFAVSLARGLNEEESIRYANGAAAISVTKLGAQSAMPEDSEVKNLIKHSN